MYKNKRGGVVTTPLHYSIFSCLLFPDCVASSVVQCLCPVYSVIPQWGVFLVLVTVILHRWHCIAPSPSHGAPPRPSPFPSIRLVFAECGAVFLLLPCARWSLLLPVAPRQIHWCFVYRNVHANWSDSFFKLFQQPRSYFQDHSVPCMDCQWHVLSLCCNEGCGSF